jgi:hypothetical protein
MAHTSFASLGEKNSKVFGVSLQTPGYSKSGIQLQEHPDGTILTQPILSVRMMNAPAIVQSKAERQAP